MGEVEAESRLLPIGETLKGSAYLTGLKGNELSLSLLLSGFIDVELDATAGVRPDGTLKATFDNLPSLPYNKFTLNLYGEKEASFKTRGSADRIQQLPPLPSHSGKTHRDQSASAVRGCDKPSFDVDLSETGKRKRTAVELDVSTQGHSIRA